jgi:uracil-DNA glycosylase family 4
MAMLPKPEGCVGCGLYGDGRGWVPDLINPSATVTLVAQNPGQLEEQGLRITEYIAGKPRTEPCTHQPLTGATGYQVDTKWLPKAGLTRDDVSLMNVLKCRLIVNGKRSNHMPTGKLLKEAVKHCSQYFKVPANTKLIVAMGQHAFHTLGGANLRKPNGKPAGVYDYRGYYLLPETYNEIPVFTVVHPADLFRDRSMLVPTALDWRRIHKHLIGSWPKPIPDRVMLNTPEQVDELFNRLQEAPWVVVDTEYAPDSHILNLVGIGAPDMEGGTVFGGQVTWVHSYAQLGTRQNFVSRFTRLAKTTPIWFWNAKADVPVLAKAWGWNLDYNSIKQQYVQLHDGMILHHSLWSDYEHSLEYAASTLGEYTKLKHLARTDPLLYNWGDVIETVEVIIKLKHQLTLDTQVEAAYERKRRLLPVIIEREHLGLRTNQSYIAEMLIKYEDRLHDTEKLAAAYCGYEINLMSPGKSGQVARHLLDYERIAITSIDRDTIADERRKFLPLDPDDENRELSITYILDRIDNGANPLLELRAMKSRLQQVLSHYLRPLQVNNEHEHE